MKNKGTHCITIYTDASVCQQTNAGGWACWVKTDGLASQLFSGMFKNPVKCPTEAELMAIVNSVVVVKKRYDLKDKQIVVVTDSQGAQRHIIQAYLPRKKVNQHLVSLAKLVWEMLPPGCLLKVNKVKAHSNKDGVRSFVNSMVDKAAKKKMREYRENRALVAAIEEKLYETA